MVALSVSVTVGAVIARRRVNCTEENHLKKQTLTLRRETIRNMQARSLTGVIGGYDAVVVATRNLCKVGSGTCGSGLSLNVSACGIPNPSEVCVTSVACGGGGGGGGLSGG